MQLISLGSSYMEDTDKNFDTLSNLIRQNEVIDITGMTLARDCALILTNYEKEKGPGRVIGSKMLDSYNEFLDIQCKQVFINKELLSKSTINSNFGFTFNNSETYQLILDKKNEIACTKIALYLIVKNYNVSFALDNSSIQKIFNYVKSICSNLINEEACNEYYMLKHNSIARYTYNELEQLNDTNLKTSDFIRANNFIPTWIFGNDCMNHTAALVKLMNLVIAEVKSMIENKKEIDTKKGKSLSAIVKEEQNDRH